MYIHNPGVGTSETLDRETPSLHDPLQRTRLDLETMSQSVPNTHFRESGTMVLSEAARRKLLEADDDSEQASNELRWSEERLELALDASRVMLWDLSLSTGEMRLSKNAVSLLGLRPEDTTTGLEFTHVHPNDRKELIHGLNLAATQGITRDTEFRWIRPMNGDELWIESRSRVERDLMGRVVALFGVMSDVTTRKRAESLRAQSEMLQRENLRIEARSRAKSKLLAHMSHELRTPLNAILGFSELLYDGHVEPISPEQRDFLGNVLKASRHLMNVIDEMLKETERSLDEQD